MCAGERDSMRRSRRSAVRDRTSRTTLTGPMARNLNAFQMHSSTSKWNQPGAPRSMRVVRMFATARYGMASYIAGTPHFSPRRVRSLFSTMLVGMYLCRKSRVWMLTIQIRRNMSTVLSSSPATRKQHDRAGRSHQVNHRVQRWGTQLEDATLNDTSSYAYRGTRE